MKQENLCIRSFDTTNRKMLWKFADAFGGHITTQLGYKIFINIINSLNNPDNLRIDKRVEESKKRTNLAESKASKKYDKPNNRLNWKKLFKTSSRDKSQRQEVQRMGVIASWQDDVTSSATDNRDDDYVSLPSENEMNRNIKELHRVLKWDDKARGWASRLRLRSLLSLNF